jgi:hypothetical protein
LSGGFVKIYGSILDSTVWVGTPAAVKVLWLTMLVKADAAGLVMASVPGLAKASELSIEDTEKALDHLSGPDRYSRTEEHEGRRIEEVDGGWRLLNYRKYRELRTDSQTREAERKAEQRRKRRDPPADAEVSRDSPGTSGTVPDVPTDAEADAEAEAEAEDSGSGGGVSAVVPPCGVEGGGPGEPDPAPGGAATRRPAVWARKAAKNAREAGAEWAPAALVEAAVVQALREIRQQEVVADRCGTAAKNVLDLWRALGYPPLADFAADVSLVARAAQMSRDKTFARDIRAEGWAEGRDRTYSPLTICVRSRWDERHRAAERWAADTGRLRRFGADAAVHLLRRHRWLDPSARPESWPELPDLTPVLDVYARCAQGTLEQHAPRMERAIAEVGIGRIVAAGAAGFKDPAAVTAVVQEVVAACGRW